jgi:hypothetical protein
VKYIREDFNPEKELRKLKFQEAQFKAGSALTVAEKTARVISRKIGIPVGTSPILEIFSNKLGKFKSFFGFMGDRAIRFNFLLSKGDIFHSIDLYDSVESMVPPKNIDLQGYNIVQVIDQVVDVITGEYLRYDNIPLAASSSNKKDNKLQEKSKYVNYIVDWLQQNQHLLNDISKGTFDYKEGSEDFLQFAKTQYGITRSAPLSSGSFKKFVADALEEGNLGINPGVVPNVKVQQGQPVQKIALDPNLQALYEKAVNPPPKQILDEMEADTRLVAQGSPIKPGLLIYGKPGTGKTQTVERVLKEEGVKPKKFDTPLTGYTGFLNALFQNKTGEVLLFDDNDSLFKDEQNINMLKKVLDMKPVRTIAVSKPTKVVGTNIVIDEDFEFDSKIIFISNQTKMEPALLSRLAGVTYSINFSKEEMLQLIKDSLYDMYAEIPDITDVMREEVFEFCEKALPAFNDIDYRAFNYVLSFRLASEKAGGGDNWKKRAFRMLKDYKKELKIK